MSGYTNVDGICKVFGIVIDHLLQLDERTLCSRRGPLARTRATAAGRPVAGRVRVSHVTALNCATSTDSRRRAGARVDFGLK